MSQSYSLIPLTMAASKRINISIQVVLPNFACCLSVIGLPKRSPKITISATAPKTQANIINNVICSS